MSKVVAVGFLLAAVAHAPASAELATVGNLTDLVFWAGTGTNQAALVVAFGAAPYGDGASPTAVAWGYRWNGSQTQADMLLALAGHITVSGSPPSPPSPQPGSDPRLFIDVQYFDGFGLTGYLVTTLRYNQVGLPSPWPQVMRHIDNATLPPENGFIDIAPYAAASGTGGGWPVGGSFGLIADTGISQTNLVDGTWYGFVEALYEVQPNGGDPIYIGFPGTLPFAQPVAAVPEPSGIALVTCAGAVVLLAARRRYDSKRRHAADER